MQCLARTKITRQYAEVGEYAREHRKRRYGHDDAEEQVECGEANVAAEEVSGAAARVVVVGTIIVTNHDGERRRDRKAHGCAWWAEGVRSMHKTAGLPEGRSWMACEYEREHG